MAADKIVPEAQANANAKNANEGIVRNRGNSSSRGNNNEKMMGLFYIPFSFIIFYHLVLRAKK